MMEDRLDPQYGDGNRAFLQAMMANGSMSQKEVRGLVAAIWNADDEGESNYRVSEVSDEDTKHFLDTASQAASLFDYEIRTSVHQITKQRIYAFVNTTSDPQTQLATTFTADELSFIKRVFDAMFDKYNTPRAEVMALTIAEARKFARPNRRESQGINVEDGQEPTPTQAVDKGLRHSEVEDVLGILVEGGWLEQSREGYYSLSQRGLLELRPWLVDTYNDPDAEPNEWQRIKFCDACKDLVTMGLRCADPDCLFRLHDACESSFWRTRRDQTCPKCSKEWEGKLYVGERARTMTNAYQKRKSRPSGGRLSTQAPVGEEDEETDEDDAELE